MAGLNIISCATAGYGNTGFGDCYLDPDVIVGAFIVPKDFELDESDLASATLIASALSEATLLASDQRVYPIGDFQQITDNSEDVTIGTLGYGGKSITKEGDYDWSFQYFKGGLCLNKSLRKFNGRSAYFLFYDNKGRLYGTKSGAVMKGIPGIVYFPPFKVNDGTNKTIYLARFIFKPTYLNDEPAFAESTLSELQEVSGLQDVALSSGGARVTNVSKVKASVGCSGTDLFDLYDSELASAALWEVRDSVSGNLITITSVAADANYKGWTITVDASDPDYSAVRAVKISMKPAATLNAAGVVGYESNTHQTPN